MPTVETNGVRVYYEIHGEGEPILIIPGLSLDLTAFNRIIQELARTYRVVAFDNRGAGRSEKPDIPYSIEMMADDTAGLLDAIGIGQAHIMGISMGGRIALALTLKRPEVVKSLILVSTSPKTRNTLGRRALFVLLEIPRRVGSLGKRYPQPSYAYRRQRQASQSYDATDRLHEIRAPTLVLQGEKDRLAPHRWAKVMRSQIPGSKMVSFDGGHLFFLWRQKEFIAAVVDFLRAVMTRAT